MVAHRRAGKTVACLNDLLKAALTIKLADGRFAYVAPHYNQAKDVCWHYLKRFAGVVPGVVFNESELRADLPNGARIRLYGADNPDRLRGIYLDGIVLDEYADMRPAIFSEIIRPLLADRKGWACFIGTPKGKNAFYELWQQAQEDPGWFSLQLKASETGLIDADELAAARSQMTDDAYKQEFECSFTAAVQGAYYASLLEQAEQDGRICSVPYDPAAEVHVAWDLGIGDSTALVFAQLVGREWHIIDYYEASGVGLDHYAAHLKSKPYNYGQMLLPHDAAAKELGTGKSRVEVLASLGVRNVRVLKASSVDDGISAVRMTLPKCWIDKTRCKPLLDALSLYRTEYDERRRVFRANPLHDWTSHAADAFRYLAVGLEAHVAPQWGQLSYANWD
ncbi:MAG: hypothetical protein RLZ58_443 [Pseudomonadota bacterium]|jgi:hypothetical protein